MYNLVEPPNNRLLLLRAYLVVKGGTIPLVGFAVTANVC